MSINVGLGHWYMALIFYFSFFLTADNRIHMIQNLSPICNGLKASNGQAPTPAWAHSRVHCLKIHCWLHYLLKHSIHISLYPWVMIIYALCCSSWIRIMLLCRPIPSAAFQGRHYIVNKLGQYGQKHREEKHSIRFFTLGIFPMLYVRGLRVDRSGEILYTSTILICRNPNTGTARNPGPGVTPFLLARSEQESRRMWKSFWVYKHLYTQSIKC